MTTTNSDKSCVCMPYNDGLLITAQILSFFALLTSWNVITEIFGMTAFVFLQIVWCCRMKSCGLVIVGVFTLIAAIAAIMIGVWALVVNDTACNEFRDTFNSEAESSNLTSTDPTYVDSVNDNIDMYCALGINTYGGVSLGSGALWLIITFCVFYFTCGSRYQSYYTQKNAEHDISNDPAITIVVDEDEQKKNGPEDIRSVTGVVIGDIV